MEQYTIPKILELLSSGLEAQQVASIIDHGSPGEKPSPRTLQRVYKLRRQHGTAPIPNRLLRLRDALLTISDQVDVWCGPTVEAQLANATREQIEQLSQSVDAASKSLKSFARMIQRRSKQ